MRSAAGLDAGRSFATIPPTDGTHSAQRTPSARRSLLSKRRGCTGGSAAGCACDPESETSPDRGVAVHGDAACSQRSHGEDRGACVPRR